MKTPLLILLVIFTGIFLTSCNQQERQEVNWPEFIDEQMGFAIGQYRAMDEALPDSVCPRTYENGEFLTSGTGWWCSGFFPGSLWYLYEYSNDETIKSMAHRRTMELEKEKNNIYTHDLGFMLYCSFGNGLRLTNDPVYEKILLTGAESLSTRYHEGIGLIRSWDHGDWQFPVIIDNMMNLEFLFWASRAGGNQKYYDLSISHTDKTIEHHFRDDFSTYHLVDYDTITGEVLAKETVQGYKDESAWARGQAWGFYGFVTLYRDTRDVKYLEQAIAIAEYMLNHKNMPEDLIPYWDFNAPDIPNALRDASAGAITASGLLELTAYVEGEDAARYMEAAKTMIYALGTTYRAEAGENGNFILMNSVGHFSADSEVDVPLTYADYYFIEALLRLKKIIDSE